MKLSYIFILGILLTACGKDKTDRLNLEVLTLNAFLLDTPDITSGPTCESECIARAQSICNVLSEKFENLPEVLFLQEVFEQDACEALTNCLRDLGYEFISPCNEEDPEWMNSCLVESSKSSGLLLASVFPVERYAFTSFTDCNGCLLQGADCQANKGFQYGLIRPNLNCEIHLINTHMDAGDKNDDLKVRRAQSTQIKDFVASRRITAEKLILYGGDFNTISQEELLELEQTLTIISLNREAVTSNSGKVLDHLLHTLVPAITDSDFELTQTCEPNCMNWFDSDHFGVLGKFAISCSE